MFKRFVFSVYFFGFAFSNFASAYDIDTHFYMTYAMARYVGIKHEVASRIALGGEWGDENIITTPMSPTILTGTQLRKVHFPGYVKAGQLSTYQFLGVSDVTKTRAMHDFASELFTEGLKERDLFKAIQSFHTMQDSFSHHGTPQIFGHAYGGHWPDRPFWRDYEWYSRMVKANIEMLWAIRELLPESALDKNINAAPASSQKTYTMSANELAKHFVSLSEVRYAATHDIMRDREYVEFAVRYLVTMAIKNGYFYTNEDIESWLGSEDYTQKKTGQEVLATLFSRILSWEKQTNGDTMTTNKCIGGRRIFNRKFMSSDLGINLCDPIWIEEHNQNPGGVITELVDVLTQGYLPVPPSPYTSLIEVEFEGPIREKEMEIRIRNVRHLIWNLYGSNIQFQPNSKLRQQLNDAFDRKPYIPKESFGIAKYDAKTGIVNISISDEDQRQYSSMLKAYLLPSLTGEKTWIEFFVGLSQYTSGSLSMSLYWGYKLWDYKNRLQADIFKSRIVPQPDNTYYRNEAAFQAYKGNQFKTNLVRPEIIEAWSLESGSDKRKGGLLYNQ